MGFIDRIDGVAFIEELELALSPEQAPLAQHTGLQNLKIPRHCLPYLVPFLPGGADPHQDISCLYTMQDRGEAGV